MANKRMLKAGDKVKLIKCKRAESKTYKGKEFTVKRAPFIFDRDIVAEIRGVRGYIPVRYLEIVNNCD